MNSPVNWVGGKSQISEDIIKLFPKHEVYIEPFFGAGWIFFRKEPSKVEIINDLNGSLVTFWKVLQDPVKNEEFQKRLTDMPCSEQLFEEYRSKVTWKDDIEQAVEFYYLIKNSFSARGMGTGEERFSGSSSRPKFGSFYNTDWKKICERFRGVCMFNRDAIDVIKGYDKPEHLIYLDPPYLMTRDTAEYYKFQDSFLHQRLLNALKELKYAKFILSYDYLPEIAETYKWCNMITVDMKYMLGNVKTSINNERRERKEYIIANFDISGSASLKRWCK